MDTRKTRLPRSVNIELVIHTVRGERVDSDFAKIYGTPTFRLNEAVKRNRLRFPEDFVFRLSEKEFASLRSQIAMSKIGRGGRRTLPYAFTEHGAIMAASVPNRPRAVEMSIFVVRAFIKMRQTLAASNVLMEKLQELEQKLTGRLDVHERAVVYVLEELRKLMKPPYVPVKKRRPIGFGREEE